MIWRIRREQRRDKGGFSEMGPLTCRLAMLA